MIVAFMRYLRMLTNAVAGGVLLALYLTILVLQLNPNLPVFSSTTLRWTGAILAFYGPYLTVLLFFLLLGRDLLTSTPLRPAWISVKLLAWLGAVGAAGAAALTWANLDVFATVLSGIARERMRDGAWATTAMAAVLLAIAILRYSFAKRGNRPVAVLLLATLALSVVVPLWLRGPGEASVRLPARPPNATRSVMGATGLRVRILALDGASLGFIRQRVALGELPNFGRLLDRGATIDLTTLRPTQAESVWAAAATGKSPQKNGVRSTFTYRVSDADRDMVDVLPDLCFAYALVNQGFVQALSLTSAALTARPMWDVVADYGVPSGVAGWPVTYPARALRGYVVSDRFDDGASSPLRLADARAGDPTTAVDVAREIFDRWLATPWHDILPALAADAPEPSGLSRARWDRAYSESAHELEQQFAPRLTAVRYEGLDVFGHNYLREAQPDLFGDLRRQDPRRSILDQYYEYIDGEIGRVMQRLAPGDLLLVVSSFGMEPMPLAKRLLARLVASPDWSGTHEPAPDGFLLAYGRDVATGQFPRGAVVDLAPTVLYYMGIDVGRDMDGLARTDLFTSTYVLEHPVKYIATHER